MITICGRKVKICTGQKSQTVNVCTADNVNGKYDYIVRLRQPFISESMLNERSFSSIDDLIQYLRSQHFGEVEKPPDFWKILYPFHKHNKDAVILSLP